MKATAKYILENKDNGIEQAVNDSLMFGMGLYTYTEDAIKSGVKYVDHKYKLNGFALGNGGFVYAIWSDSDENEIIFHIN